MKMTENSAQLSKGGVVIGTQRQVENTSRTAEARTNTRAARSGRPYLAGDWEGRQRAGPTRWELFPSLSV